MKVVIPSKKIQVNSFDHELVKEFLEQTKEKMQEINTIVIQGNSYSLDFCKEFSEVVLAKAENLTSLDVSDIFVARLKEEIPASI